MATWTKAQLATKVLEYLGVVPAGQSASSEDSTLVQSVIDSVVDQLDSAELVPFSITAIPTWAQWPLVKYVAVEVGPAFGKPMPEQLKMLARRDMERAAAGYRHPIEGKTRYY